MTAVQTRPGVPVPAFDALATLQRLMLEAGLSDNIRHLTFQILNRTVAYCRYDRAVLWAHPTHRPRILGVSGNVEFEPDAPLAREWRTIVRALRRPDTAARLEPATLPDAAETWTALARRTGGLSVIWLPLHAHGRLVAGLWLERWEPDAFTPRDLARLEPLALAYGVAWRSVTRPPSRWRTALGSRKGLIAGVATVALLLAGTLVRLPLRIVASCEIVPDEPVLITAPLDGVLDEVAVLPGRAVEVGDLLAVYDRRVPDEEIRVAARQVQIIAADLQRARVQALETPRARAEVALLENRLAQERTRLHFAQERMDKLEIRAPSAGTLMFDDPHQWRGRPVQVGERIMMIADARRTKVRIWLPERDNIPLDWARPLLVVLDADPRGHRRAELRFLANHSEVNREGLAAFRAEAEWVRPHPQVKMGLQGTAVLYGADVPLGYWLLRRPVAAVRRCFGV